MTNTCCMTFWFKLHACAYLVEQLVSMLVIWWHVSAILDPCDDHTRTLTLSISNVNLKGGYPISSPAHDALTIIYKNVTSSCINTLCVCCQIVKMTDRSGKCNIMKLVKIVSLSLLFVVIVCFVAATLRTLTFDVNSGLQLAHWEKTNNIASDINQHQRKELLANFRGEIRPNFIKLSKFDSLCGVNNRYNMHTKFGQRHRLVLYAEAIQIPTVSTAKTQLNITALGEFDSLLRRGNFV